MAMNLVLTLATLVQQGKLEQCPDIGALTGQGNENRYVSGIVLRILAVRIEIYGPLVASDGEVVAGDVLSDAHAFGQGIALDHEPVEPLTVSVTDRELVGETRRVFSCVAVSDIASESELWKGKGGVHGRGSGCIEKSSGVWFGCERRFLEDMNW